MLCSSPLLQLSSSQTKKKAKSGGRGSHKRSEAEDDSESGEGEGSDDEGEELEVASQSHDSGSESDGDDDAEMPDVSASGAGIVWPQVPSTLRAASSNEVRMLLSNGKWVNQSKEFAITNFKTHGYQNIRAVGSKVEIKEAPKAAWRQIN